MFFFFNAAFLAIVAVCNLAYDLVGQSVLFLPLAGPLLAQSGHSRAADQCPLSGVERTSSFSIGDYAAPMHVGPVEVQIAFDLRPAIGGLSLIAFGKPDFSSLVGALAKEEIAN
jgi:hypothetical protein